MQRTSRAPEILSMIEQSPNGMRVIDVARTLQISHQLASIHLMRMTEVGKVEQIKRGLYCTPERATAIKKTLVTSHEELVKRYLAGENVSQIAASTKVTRDIVWRTLKEAGVVLRKRVQTRGKASTYQNGCRCDPCTDANTAKQAKTRRERSERGSIPIHGSASTFTNYDCRCDPCVHAHREKLRNRTRSDFDTSNSRKPWTPEDLAYILARQDGRRYLHTARQCAIELRRSVSSIDAQRFLHSQQTPS